MTRDVEQFSDILYSLNIYSEELVNNFEGLLLSESSPENWFEFIASGAFKECYKLTDEYIIKFATEENNSEEELYILAAAEEANIAEIFLPTQFMSLKSCTLPSYYTNETDSYDKDPSSYPLNSLFIQPFANKIAANVPSSSLSLFNYRNAPIYNKNDEILPYEIFKSLNICHRIWIEDAFNFYGLDFLERLGNFIQENNIYDLHNANIGWIVENGIERPIILDWLSSYSS